VAASLGGGGAGAEGLSLALGASEFVFCRRGGAGLVAAVVGAGTLAKALAGRTPCPFPVLGGVPWPIAPGRRGGARPEAFTVFIEMMRPLAGACTLFHAAIELVGLTSASKFRYVTFFPAPVEGWPSG
ncbi:hypothetical protein, partial [Propionivibrio sp.]|uniref:hypothetical protein n=1 Tax=Propionivibrio sp. TaxID=2212460 RepID=UPI00262B779F